jgi:hypothetical protein
VEEGPGGTVLGGEVDPGRLLEAWRAARAVTPTLGRWPILTRRQALAEPAPWTEPQNGGEPGRSRQVAR